MFIKNTRYNISFELMMNAAFTIDFLIVAIFIDDVHYASIVLAEVFWCLSYIINALVSYGSMTVRAKYLGANDKEGSDRVFTASLMISVLSGGAIVAFGLLFPDAAAAMCGMNSEMIGSGSRYIMGSCAGIIPYIVSRMIIKNIITDGAHRLCLAACMVSGAVNVILDFIVLKIFHLGTGAVGLTTSFSYLLLLLIVCTYFRSGHSALRLISLKKALPACAEIIGVGASKGFIQLGTMLCMMLINNLVVVSLGMAGASALAVKDSLNCLLLAAVEGSTETFGMLTSLMYGERNKVGIKQTMHASLTRGFIDILVISAVVFAAASPIAAAFGVSGQESAACAVECLRCLAASVPLTYLSYLIASYLAVSRERIAAGFFSALIVFIAPVTVILTLKWAFGIDELWRSYPIAAAAAPVVFLIWRYAKSRSGRLFMDRIAALPEEEFSFDHRYSASIRNDIDTVKGTVLDIRDFCAEHGIDKRRSNILQLSVEEMVNNIITHGFKDGTEHVIDISVKVRKDDILLRIRDDGIRFNPLNYKGNNDDPMACIGIMMIKKCSVRVDYYHAASMNNLVVEV